MLGIRRTRRREFVGLLGGAATAGWLLAARAQQAGHIRRIAALWPFSETDVDGQAAIAAFREAGLRREAA